MEDFQDKKKVLVRYTNRSYDHFYNLTYYSLKQAEEQEKLRFYNSMITMVFCAFAIEAFLNHLGAQIISDWESIERKINIHEKIKLVYKTENLTINKNKEPLCYLYMIFDYRDEIAHGRTLSTSEYQIINPDGFPEMPTAGWEKMTTLQKAKDFRKYTMEIITSLGHDLANDDFPLGSSSDASWCSL